MVGTQVHLALPLGDSHLTPHQRQKDSPPGLSHPLEAEILAFVSLGGVSVFLSARLSDLPLDSSTQEAGNPGPATSLKVTLELPSLPQGHQGLPGRLNLLPTWSFLLPPPHVPSPSLSPSFILLLSCHVLTLAMP